LGWKIIISIILVIAIIFFFIQNTLTPIFFSLAEVEAVRIANKAVNEAVNEEIEISDCSNLVRYEFKYNQDGEIILVQPNIKYINSFTSKISLRIQRKLEEISKMEVSVPLAKILGIELLAGLGPDLSAKIIPVGFIQPPEIKDSFTTAGINQTRHKIYLKVVTRLKLIVPFHTKTIDVKADIPVNEVTILGRVPRVYIGLDGENFSGIISKDFAH